MASAYKVGSAKIIGLAIGLIALLVGGCLVWYLGGWDSFMHKLKGQPEIQICNRQLEDKFYDQTCLNIFTSTNFEIQQANDIPKSQAIVTQAIDERRLQDSINLELFANQAADNCPLIGADDNQSRELETSYWIKLRGNKYSFDKQCNNDYLNQTVNWLLDESKSETIASYQIKEAPK